MRFLLIVIVFSYGFTQNRKDLVTRSVIGVPIPIKDHSYFTFYNLYKNNENFLVFSYEFNTKQFMFEQNSDSAKSAIIEYSLFINSNSKSITEIWVDTLNKRDFRKDSYLKRNIFIKTDIDSFDFSFKIYDKNAKKESIYKYDEKHIKSEFNILFKQNKQYSSHKSIFDQSLALNVIINKESEIDGDYNLKIKSNLIEKSFLFQRANDLNLVLEIDLKTFLEDLYNIQIIKNKTVVSEQTIIVQNWGIPFSLKELNFALIPFKILLSENQIKLFDLQSFNDKVRYFYDYWQEKVSSKDAYNPLMLEYYKRVDYSILNYSNKLDSGWETDRGKTYILYGKPINLTRQIEGNREFEIWEYRTFRKTFQKINMVYKLVNTRSASD